MPQQVPQKDRERYYAEQTARMLGEEWQLSPSESPDFVVSSTDGQFGLEVTQVHIGTRTRSGGSRERASEIAHRRWLKSIREEFSNHSKSVISLRFLGTPTEGVRRAILEALVREDFDSKPEFHKLDMSFEDGKIWAFKSRHAVWTFLPDSVGWVSQDGGYLDAAIEAKASRLESYRQNCGLGVRLLVVADRTANSGKLVVEDDFQPDLRGFDRVYFLSYPTELRTF